MQPRTRTPSTPVILLSTVFAFATPTTALTGEPSYTEATTEIGISGVHASGCLYGPGVAAVDFDRDGDLDLFVSDDTDGNRLYRNDGGTLIDVAPALGINWRPSGNTSPGTPGVLDVGSMMPCLVDIDNDGDRDLFLTVWNEPSHFWRNNGNGSFTDETEAVGIWTEGSSATGAWGDYNCDGFLDVYISDWTGLDNLYRNNGGNAFANRSDASSIWEVNVPQRPGWAAIWYYHDSDIWPDLYVANDFTFPNFCYWNLGNGSFLDYADTWFEPGENTGTSMGIALGDFDHDGDDDLYVSNAWSQNNDFYKRLPNRYVNLSVQGDPITIPLKDTRIGWFCDWLDADNDGWLDLYLVNGYMAICPRDAPEFPHACAGGPDRRQTNRLWKNVGGSFVDHTVSSGLGDEDYGRGAGVSDFDLDGDLDIFVTNNNGPYRYMRNDTADTGNSLVLRFTGTSSNRDAIGTRVFATVGSYTHRRTLYGASGYLSQPSDEIHIGVGDATQIDQLRIVWPRGREEIFANVPVNLRLSLVEGLTDTRTVLPAAPVLQAAPFNRTIELRASYPTDAGYEEIVVHRARGGRWSGVVHREIAGNGEFVWRDVDVVDGESYRYRVMAIASDLELSSAAVEVIGSSVPVLLPALRASALANGVQLHWDFEADLEIDGFRIRRHGRKFAQWTVLHGGQLLEPASRDYLDATASASESYVYELSAWHGGSQLAVQTVNVTGTAFSLRLESSSPNPCTSTTTIAFELPRAQQAEITLFDLRGRMVCRLFSDTGQAGLQFATWDGRDDAGNPVPNGVYFYRLTSGGMQVSRRLTLLAATN